MLAECRLNKRQNKQNKDSFLRKRTDSKDRAMEFVDFLSGIRSQVCLTGLNRVDESRVPNANWLRLDICRIPFANLAELKTKKRGRV